MTQFYIDLIPLLFPIILFKTLLKVNSTKPNFIYPQVSTNICSKKMQL